MMVVNVDSGRIIIYTDDISVKCCLEFKKKERVFRPWMKVWVYEEIIDSIYEGSPKKTKPDTSGIYTFVVGLGWAAYVANMFKDRMSLSDYENLLTAIRATSYRQMPFAGLRDHQNEDVLHLLKYKIGLCTTNTSYGKTQVIATLANYAYSELNKSVLLVTPGKKAKDELVKRCKSLFNLEIPSADGRLNCIITTGLLNNKKYKDPNLLPAEEAKLAVVDWVLVDEVEYTINPGGEFLYSRLHNADHFYGFSGTADKFGGKMISFAQGLTETVTANKDLIKFFGPSLVYRMPMNLSVDNITVLTESLNKLTFDEKDFAQDSNVYMNIMNKIWTDHEICETIVRIARRFPMMFIPINNLNSVIQSWIDNYFLGEFRVLLISGEGYIYYDLDGSRTKLTLEQACDYVRNKKVDIIPSTSSGYRALDFPGLENILLIQGIVAGVVLQSIGRVARSTHMNIISLAPKFPTRIPVYSKGAKERDDMIQEYYKYCTLRNVTIDENSL